MVETEQTAASRPGGRRRRAQREGALANRRRIAFGVAFAVPLSLAFQGGGYDLVARQEVGLVVWSAIALGLAFDLLPRGEISRAAAVSLGGFAALIALMTLAFGWTESDERTFEELSRVIGYAGFAVLAYLSLSRYTARAAAAGLSSAALVLPLFAIASRIAPDLLTDRAVEVLNVDRLSYPLGYWNALACWGAMAIAIGLVWSAHARSTWVRATALALVPAAGLTVYLSYSRAGAAAAVIAVLAAVAFSRARWQVSANAAGAGVGAALAIAVARGQTEIARADGTEGAAAVVVAVIGAGALCAAVAALTTRLGMERVRVGREIAAAVVVSAFIVGLLSAATVGKGPIEEGWDEFRNQGAPVKEADPEARFSSLGGARYSAWEAALDAFNSDQARGVGPGAYEYWWAREGDKDEYFRDAHSLYLETLAELGVPGLLALLAAMGAALWAAVASFSKRTSAVDVGAAGAMIAAFLVFAFYAAADWVWEVPALVVLGVGGIAVAGAGGFERWGRRRVPVGIRVAGVAGALVLFAVQVPALVSTERLRASAAAARADDTGRALELAQDSIDAMPFAAAPYAQRALVRERLGQLDAAESDLELAAEKEETNWRHQLLLARIAARQGDRSQMERRLSEAKRLSPRSAFLTQPSQFRIELDELLSEASSSEP